MIKKIFSALVVVLFATSMMAQSGLTCEDPIPVDKSYVAHVEAESELWYTAWSYDLPLHVYFSPDSSNTEWGPEVSIDFSCTGDYSFDHKLDSVINILSFLGLSLPVEFMCDKVVRDGKVEWDLSIDERYRNQMTEYGLTHNVQAFVKVYFPYSGEIRLTPDPTFQTCMESGHYVQLGDTIDIAANDSAKMFVLPFSEWQKDSIRLVWVGDNPARVWVAEEDCQFTPVDASIYVRTKYDIDKDNPKKLYPADMKNAIDNWIGSGIFYGKVLSEGPGKLVVEKIPLGLPQGSAVVLKRGETVELTANDERVFCFPKGWTSTEFLSSSSSAIKMYVSHTAEFAPVADNEDVIAIYPFRRESGNMQLQLSTGDIATLSNSASDDYLYVRFECDHATSLTLSSWNISSCLAQTILISSNQPISLPTSSKSVYRMLYEDWSNNDFTINWTGRTTLVAYVSSYCDFVSTDPGILKGITVPARKSTIVNKNLVNSWAASVNEDGYLYLRLESTRSGDVTFISAKPELPDPVYTTIDATLCYGEVYEWNGQTYTATGEYTQTLVAANGADSIVTLKLTIRPEVAAVEEKDTVCYGESYTWQGTTYTETGEYSTTLQDENGCDYQAVLNLTVLPEVAAVEEKATVCYGESYTWQGTTYTDSGEYSTTLQDENGCDYQAVLNLTVLPEVAATTETVEVPFGETYTWHGTTYAESGSYTITLQDANGCDYQATLHLTVLPEPEKTDLLPNDALSVSLPTALNVYAMDYAAWKAQDVKWQWTGSTPLYVFVAKSSDYALTPQNRHVLLFAPIEPGEEIVLTKEQVSAWESLAEGGMIYVRLLTEKSGQLTTVAE